MKKPHYGFQWSVGVYQEEGRGCIAMDFLLSGAGIQFGRWIKTFAISTWHIKSKTRIKFKWNKNTTEKLIQNEIVHVFIEMVLDSFLLWDFDI